MAQTMLEVTSGIWTSTDPMTAEDADLRNAVNSALPQDGVRKRGGIGRILQKRNPASGNYSGMPPIAQFVLHAFAWCRTKWTAKTSDAAPLKLVSQLALGGKRSLSLVEADGLRFLVGGGTESVTIIVPVVPTVAKATAANTTALDATADGANGFTPAQVFEREAHAR